MSVLAVDLGGTHLRVAVVDDDGTVHDPVKLDTPDVPDVAALVALLGGVDAGRSTSAIIGVPGRVDYGAGRMELAPNLLDAWNDVLVESVLAEALAMPVALANDADMAAVGEAWFGAGRGFADVAYLTVSTGVGAGVVTGGLLCHGRRSMAEVGHTVIARAALAIGMPATVEGLGSGTALARLAVAVGLPTEGAEVVALAEAGDAVASGILHDVLGAAALGAVNLAHLFTPDVLVVGGGLGRQGGLVLAPMRQALADHGPQGLPRPIEVVIAALGDEAGLAGAGAWSRAFVPQAAGR